MMYTVSSELYRETAARLCDALDGESYYSGSLEFVFDGMECRLVVSVIAYRRREVAPEGGYRADFRPGARLVGVPHRR